MTGRVTAIVSAYFCEDWLERRLVNLEEQDEQPEIIVICQNNSAEHRVAEKHDCRIIVTEDVPTIDAAWNIGAKAAQGKYLTNANADDLLKPGALKRMADTLDKNTTHAVCYSNVDVVDYKGDPAGVYEWAEGGLQKLLGGCFLGPMPMWRASLHKQHGYFDGEYHVAGDYEYWMRLAAAGEKFFHIRESLGIYTARGNSAEHRESLRTLWETSRARGKYR